MNSQQRFVALCATMIDDEWRKRIEREIDTAPEKPDNASRGRHYPLTDEEAVVELEDLIDARDDVEFTRWGGN